MEFQQYLIESERTLKSLGKELDLLHCATGLVTESAELVDAIKKHVFYGKSLDVVNIKEELGDILWYIAIPVRMFDLDLDFNRQNGNYYKNKIKNQIKTPEGLIKFFLTFNSMFKALCSAILIRPLPSDFDNIFEEINLICEIYNLNLSEIMDININKLKARFPNNFTQEHALNRDLEKERAILEGEVLENEKM